MWKIGLTGTRVLKILHLLLVVLFLGGILCSFALTMKLNLSKFDDVYATYKGYIIISDNIVKIGAQGTILLGLVYGFFTRWGFIKYRLIAVKWVIFIVQTIMGIFLVDKLTVTNMGILEAEKVLALNNPVFTQNHTLRTEIMVAQIVLTVLTLVISVFKPWRRATD